MKRTLLSMLTALLVIVGGPVAGGPVVAAPAASGWAQDGYDAGNTGYNPAETVINARTIGRLRPSWVAEPSTGSEGCWESRPPVVAGGRMFTLDGDAVGAYDVRDGRLLWQHEGLHTAIIGRTVRVVGDTVVMTGLGCFGDTAYVLALDARTGRERWQAEQNGIAHAVVADRGMLITATTCAGCGGSQVIGYRLRDGARMWTVRNATTGPVLSGGRLLLAGPGPGSTAVDVTTGRTLWRTPVTWSVRAANPAGTVFFAATSARNLGALDAATGRMLWSVPSADGELAVDAGAVYVSDGTGTTAYETYGERRWRNLQTPNGRPVRAGDLLYLPGAVLDPATGARIPASLPHPHQHPVITGGRLYILDGDVIRTFVPG